MKTLNLRTQVIVAITTLGFAVSATAANIQTTHEEIIATYIADQSQQVMLDLSDQLQKSIARQVQNFSMKNISILLNNSATELMVQETAQPNITTQKTTKSAEE